MIGIIELKTWRVKMKLLRTTIFVIACSLNQFQPLAAEDIDQPDVEMVDFVNVRNVTKETFQEIMMGNLPNLAIEFSEGDVFPFDLFLDGDLVSLLKPEGAINHVQFNRTVLMRNKNGKLFFSTDLHCWRPFRAFVTGKIQAGINLDDEEVGPVISFGAEVNEKVHHGNN